MNIKLIIGAIIGLLLIGSTAHAQYYGGCYRGQGACGFYGPPQVICGGGCYGGGYYGGGWNSYGVCQTAVTLNGVANIISAVTPIVTTAIQPSVQIIQPQPQVVYIINPK